MEKLSLIVVVKKALYLTTILCFDIWRQSTETDITSLYCGNGEVSTSNNERSDGIGQVPSVPSDWKRWLSESAVCYTSRRGYEQYSAQSCYLQSIQGRPGRSGQLTSTRSGRSVPLSPVSPSSQTPRPCLAALLPTLTALPLCHLDCFHFPLPSADLQQGLL